LNNYYALTHPSQPNYIAVTGGDYFGLGDDGMHSIPSSYKTIVDLLEAKGGLTWKAYQEDAPTACYTGYESDSLYFRKHNPFINYDSIATNATRCSNIVPATQLQTDLAAGSMPNYAFYTPNLINDGQNSTVAQAAIWLTGFLPPLLANKSFINKTLVVVTFDESEDYNVPNNVYTLLLGDVVASVKAATDSTFYTHYSLLSTVEANWGLGNLGRQDTNMTVNNVFQIVAKAAGITTHQQHLDGECACIERHRAWILGRSHSIFLVCAAYLYWSTSYYNNIRELLLQQHQGAQRGRSLEGWWEQQP